MVKLVGIQSKSFNNYTCNEELVKVNIFFGQNGSGKSALSSWVKSQDPEGTRIFDTSYVEANVRQKTSLSGTNIIVGKEQIQRDASINQATKVINNIEKSDVSQKIDGDKSILYDLMQKEIEKQKKQPDLKLKCNT